MKKAFSPKQKPTNMGFVTQPWFVIALVLICFGILTPKIFLPLFMQIFGLNKVDNRNSDRSDPRMRSQGVPRSPPIDPRTGPQFGRPGPSQYSQPQAAPSGSKSLLTFLLPVYAIAIGIYMFYTLFKVFKKDEPKTENDSDYEEIEKKNYAFKEVKTLVDQDWDPNSSEFKTVGKHFARSEESEDEMNEYARYNNLDPEYIEYLKQMRREKREKKALMSKSAAKIESNEIALTPGTGLTSITNTNVLMNDTLERMKHSLNKINKQLIEVEKKGNPLEDPELDSLRLQLTQTELQMGKIMTIVNSVSASLDGQNEDEDGSEDIDDDDECFFHQEVPRVHNHHQQMPNESTSNLRNRMNIKSTKHKKQQQQQQFEGSISSHSLSSAGSENEISSENEWIQSSKGRKPNVAQITAPNDQKPVNYKNQQKNLRKKLRKKAKKAKNES